MNRKYKKKIGKPFRETGMADEYKSKLENLKKYCFECYFVNFKYIQLSDLQIIEKLEQNPSDKNIRVAEYKKDCLNCQDFLTCSSGHNHFLKKYHFYNKWMANEDIEHKGKKAKNNGFQIFNKGCKKWVNFK